MKLFFNREAEKSPIVRDHRELILAIHGVLAWELQTQSENGKGAGSFTKSELQRRIREYLILEEHKPDLVDPLLAGTVERVGALVSRLEGTFEFEVQPLREYFSARHLYKTAAYSPQGRSLRGTRPDRLDALVRSSYWTNVTRFFCGFYDVGELGSLVDGLIQLDSDAGFRLISQPRRVAMMLLSDHVFGQSPRTMKRLITHVTKEPGFELLGVSESGFGASLLSLPELAGRRILFENCSRLLRTEDDPIRRRVLRGVMAANADADSLVETWRSLGKNPTTYERFQEALDFGILDQFSSTDIAILTEHDMELCVRWLIFIGRFEHIIKTEDLYESACKMFFDEEIVFFRPPRARRKRTHLEVLSTLLSPHGLAYLHSCPTERQADTVVAERSFGTSHHGSFYDEYRDLDQTDNDPVAQFTGFVVGLMRSDVADWKLRLRRWESLVDRGLEVSRNGFIFQQIAAISTAVESDGEHCTWDEEGFRPCKGLVRRLYHAARMVGDHGWWARELDGMDSRSKTLGLGILLAWGDAETLRALRPKCESIIDGMDSEEWRRLRSVVRCIEWAGGTRLPELGTRHSMMGFRHRIVCG